MCQDGVIDNNVKQRFSFSRGGRLHVRPVPPFQFDSTRDDVPTLCGYEHGIHRNWTTGCKGNGIGPDGEVVVSGRGMEKTFIGTSIFCILRFIYIL